ncbi:MAG: hypothetical protein ACYCW6_28285, partial [Candidatus Xenobia bacterium]
MITPVITPKPPTPAPPPQQLDQAIATATQKVQDVVDPIISMTQGIDLTQRANKDISDKLSKFGQALHETGVELHPFKNYNEMVEAWLGATEFHRFSDARNPTPATPALTLKAVQEVCRHEYNIVHITNAPDWQGHQQSPRFTQVRTDYDKTETVPQDVVYLLEDDKHNHLIVQLQSGNLSVIAHNDQKDLVDQFYHKIDDWNAKNNFYKNKVLTYNGTLDFQDGLKAHTV